MGKEGRQSIRPRWIRSFWPKKKPGKESGKGRWKGIVEKRVKGGAGAATKTRKTKAGVVAEAAIKTRKKEVEVGTRRKKVGVVAGKSTIEKEKKKRKIGRRTMTEGSAV